MIRGFVVCAALGMLGTAAWAGEGPAVKKQPPRIPAEKILTPKPPPEPRINGPKVFGVRPGHPFLYRIPATGERPMQFRVEGLPEGLDLDELSGQIMGRLAQAGEHEVVLVAKNARGESRKDFRIVVGEKIALTPPMGWNSWYCFQLKVDQENVLRAAGALAKSGLVEHGWTYVNIDDTWQGARTGEDHALQSNKEKFPDMKAMCDEIHSLGMKAGIYSTPWITSYALQCGGTSDNPDGAWSREVQGNPKSPKFGKERFGKHSFAEADARQWAAWGFDFMKYDWYPNDLEHIKEMSKALRASGRDIVFSLSNKAVYEMAPELTKWANMWRTSGDISDAWEGAQVFLPMWSYCISEVAFSQDRWAPYAGPGHWNDPDMMQVGVLGHGPSKLTADEQYSLVSMWCMLSAPLLIGGDPDQLDPFTLNLLTNDEVLAVNQDSLGIQATKVAADGPFDIYKKPLDDGTVALGLFNRDSAVHTLKYNKLIDIGLGGRHHVRDLWRQKDLPDAVDIVDVADRFEATVPGHGVLLLKLTPVKEKSRE
jgi:alpha-galactosidase